MSAGAAFLCQAAGRVWFEVEVLAVSNDMVVGFAGTNFRAIRGAKLGSDERGWGVVESGAAKHRRAVADFADAAATQISPGLGQGERSSGNAGIARDAAGTRGKGQRHRAGAKLARRSGSRWTSDPAPCASPSTAANGPSPSPRAAPHPPMPAPPCSQRSAALWGCGCGATGAWMPRGR